MRADVLRNPGPPIEGGREPQLQAVGLRLIKGGAMILDIDQFTLEQGDVLGVIGPNGAGKSSLLHVLALLEKPSSGKVLFAGQDVRYDQRTLVDLRRQTAVVFQEPLLLNTTVRENVAAGLRLRRLPIQQIERQVTHWLGRLGVGHLESRKAHTLSGGEAQRVSVARALALGPKVLYLDEPFASLDAPTKGALMTDLQRVLRETGITTILVTHDFTDLPYLVNRVAVMMGGRIVQQGSPAEVLSRPDSTAIARFVGVDNILTLGDDIPLDSPLATALQENNTADRGDVVCLRPESVTVHPGPLNPGSRMDDSVNLRGAISSIDPQGLYVKLTGDCGGFPIEALVSSWEVTRNNLQKGSEITISLPLQALHVLRSP